MCNKALPCSLDRPKASASPGAVGMAVCKRLCCRQSLYVHLSLSRRYQVEDITSLYFPGDHTVASVYAQ